MQHADTYCIEAWWVQRARRMVPRAPTSTFSLFVSLSVVVPWFPSFACRERKREKQVRMCCPTLFSDRRPYAIAAYSCWEQREHAEWKEALLLVVRILIHQQEPVAKILIHQQKPCRCIQRIFLINQELFNRATYRLHFPTRGRQSASSLIGHFILPPLSPSLVLSQKRNGSKGRSVLISRPQDN